MSEQPTTRDVRMVNRLVELPEWKIPAEAMDFLPKMLLEICSARHPAGHPKAGQYVYAARARTSAARTFQTMVRDLISLHPPTQELEVNHRIAPDLKQALRLVRDMSDEELQQIEAAAAIVQGVQQPDAA